MDEVGVRGERDRPAGADHDSGITSQGPGFLNPARKLKGRARMQGDEEL
jgi:hypothetical protein